MARVRDAVRVHAAGLLGFAER